MFTPPTIAKVAIKSAARGIGPAKAGMRVATLSAKTVATAATA